MAVSAPLSKGQFFPQAAAAMTSVTGSSTPGGSLTPNSSSANLPAYAHSHSAPPPSVGVVVPHGSPLVTPKSPMRSLVKALLPNQQKTTVSTSHNQRRASQSRLEEQPETANATFPTLSGSYLTARDHVLLTSCFRCRFRCGRGRRCATRSRRR